MAQWRDCFAVGDGVSLTARWSWRDEARQTTAQAQLPQNPKTA